MTDRPANDPTRKRPPRSGEGQPTKLTPKVQNDVCAFIRAGMWDHRAAESAGIGRSTFYLWLQRGGAQRRGIYREFLDEVTKASAQAAGYAETRVYQEKPLEWLRVGPGRDRPGAPGWTDSAEVKVQGQMTERVEVRVVYVNRDGNRDAVPAGAAPGTGNGDGPGRPV